MALSRLALSRRVPVALAALGTAALLTACIAPAEDAPSGGGGGGGAAADDPGAGGEQSTEPIRIGVVMARSGFMGPIDTPALQAMELYAEQLNEEGGIDGREVVLDVVDTGTNLDRYASAATEVIGRGADVLVTTCDYDVASPAALVAESSNIVSFAPCIGDPIYGPDGGLPNGYSMGNGTPGEASVIAEFAHAQGWTTAFTLTDTTLKYTQNQCEVFTQRFEELGGTIVGSASYQQGDSIRETVSRMASGEAPGVVVNCGYSPGGATAAKEIRDGGISAPIISGFGMDGDFWTSGIPGLTDYYIVTYGAINGDDPVPEVNEFADRYEERYGERPSVSSFTTGPSVLQAVKTAYEAAGTFDAAAMTAELESFDGQELLVGPTTFTSDLHINVERPQRVLNVQDGKLVFLEQRAPEKVVFTE